MGNAHDRNVLVPRVQRRFPASPLYLTEVLVGIGGADYLPSGLVSVPFAPSLISLTSPLT